MKNQDDLKGMINKRELFLKNTIVICVITVAFAICFLLKMQIGCLENEKTRQITTTVLKTSEIRKILTTKAQIIGFGANIITTSDKFMYLSGEEGKEDEEDTLPLEYGDFLEAIPEGVESLMPDGAFSQNADEVGRAASEIGSVTFLFGVIADSFGSSFSSLLPTLASLCACVMLSALCHSFVSGFATAGTVSFAVRLCSFCVISATAVSSLERLEAYFDSLFAAVASFIPLGGVLMAMGGNLNGAASGTATFSATLAVCEFFCAKTVIPIFCICLGLSVVTVFDGHSAFVGRSLATTVKKWYMAALGFVMMILTVSIIGQSVISSKLDSAAMRGAKYAIGNFIPVSGGVLSGTLGAIASSVELLRGAVGVVGIGVILLMLIPIIIELALLRGIFALAAFLSGLLSASGEQSLLSSISELYGYLEGVAALSAAVFVVAFAVFAASTGAVA